MSALLQALPRPRWRSVKVLNRNFRVWRRLIAPSLFFNFGEPFIYLLGLGFGLGNFIGEIGGMPYLTFLASGLVAASSMNVASFEGMFSVYTRMVPQQTYEALLATPLQVDDIVAGEMLWCATKSVISASAILAVATLLGAVTNPTAIMAIPVFFLTGLCFAGPALVMAAISPSYDFFNYYVTTVLTPMFIFCGVFYPISTLPNFAQIIVEVLPLSHAVAVIRPLVSGQGWPDGTLLHLGVLAAYAVVGYLAATVFVRRRLVI